MNIAEKGRNVNEQESGGLDFISQLGYDPSTITIESMRL